MNSTVLLNDHRLTLEEPTQAHFNEWLETLPSAIATQLSSHGFEKCKDLLSLRLHVAEQSLNH